MSDKTRTVKQASDDCAIVHVRASDGSTLHDVEVYFEDNEGEQSTLTIGCTNAAHARRLFKAIDAVAHLTFTKGRP
jgi:hypothetical protein